jgi:hypothetical protein
VRHANGEAALDADVSAFLGRGVAIIVATRDEQLRPEITRGWGPVPSPDGRSLRICLAAEPGSRTVENLACCRELAATFSLPSTYRSVQLKGTVQEHGEPTPADLAAAEAHVAQFVDEVVRMGIPPALAPRFAEGPYIAVTIALRELYDQTPGARAGAPL